MKRFYFVCKTHAKYQLTTLFLQSTAFQDGGCEHGDVGRGVQHDHRCSILPQLEVLPIRLLGELLHCTLPISSANALLVGQTIEGPGTMLQLQITPESALGKSFDPTTHSSVSSSAAFPVTRCLISGAIFRPHQVTPNFFELDKDLHFFLRRASIAAPCISKVMYISFKSFPFFSSLFFTFFPPILDGHIQ